MLVTRVEALLRETFVSLARGQGGWKISALKTGTDSSRSWKVSG